MTPDDVSVPGDDAIARAARDGLRHLAGAHARNPFDWDGVRARARRVRQQRLVAFVAACALVIGSAGAAVASTGHDDARAPIAGYGDATTTSTTTSTDSRTTTTGPAFLAPTTPAPSDTSAADPAPVGVPTPPPAPVALPSDFAGSITVASTLWHVGEPQPVTLAIRNASDHPVSLPTDKLIGIGLYVSFLDNVSFGRDLSEVPFAPGEQRTYTVTMTPSDLSLGSTRLTAGFVRGIVMDVGGYLTAAFPGVPSVPITIAPPGWKPGDLLDPAMGKWDVVVSVDLPLAADQPVRVHGLITNTGTEVQAVAAYTSIALRCGPGSITMDDAPVASLAPGDSTTWSADYWPLDSQRETTCSSGFSTVPAATEDVWLWQNEGFVDHPVTFTLGPGNPVPTTTRSTTTTSHP